jgi:hypothetical protein
VTGGGETASGTAAATSWSVEAMSAATVVDETELICVSGPSSPGLSTRTEMEMLHPLQLAGSTGAAASDPQLQFQFQSHSGVDEVGVIELDPTEPSEQFQLQFQTQFTDPTFPRSGKAI